MKYIYHGASHIHTTYSDGTSDIKEIAQAAQKAGLSWIIISDHNNLKGLENGEEGWYGNLAVIIGEEISPEDSDHYLAFDIKKTISPDGSPSDFIKQVKEQGGIGFVAHPDENLDRKSSYKPLRWTDWSLRGFDGVEIWNHLSDWVDNYDPKKALKHFLFRENILSGPSAATLKWWDELNNEVEDILPAIGGVDIHALIQKYFGLKVKVFPYKSSFKTVTNTLFLDEKLSKDFEEAKKQIFKALKQGNNVIVNKTWSKGQKVPMFYVENPDKRVFSGETIKLGKYTRMIVKLPHKALLRVIYDGQLIWEYETRFLEFDKLDVGKYRIEVYYKGRPWIFSNPIKLIKETDGE